MNYFRKLKYFLLLLSAALFLIGSAIRFSTSAQSSGPFQTGERLTYNISFENIENAAYAEIHVVSDGKLDGKDAVELSARVKSVNLVSAAFYLFDEMRTTFVDEQTGLPLYVRTISNASGLPKEKISNFLASPTVNYDLLSLIYKVRNSGGGGSFSVQENDSVYNFDFIATGGETVKTDTGEYETTISNVQSSYLTELGIAGLRINFTSDEKRIPVLIRLKTDKGSFVAKIASIQNLEPVATPTPSPTAIAKPVVTPVRTPVPTPTPYINNRSLSTDLPFVLGERLEYKVTGGAQDYGKVFLQVKERKEFDGEDRLLLVGGISEVGKGTRLFDREDVILAQVDPYTLAPNQVQINLKSSFSIFNQVADFDQDLGKIEYNGGNEVEVPIGTHSILSLAYAIRNFNLKPSLDSKNPVNDTRVALFLGSKSYILTLRPSTSTITNREGKKISVRLISIQTGNPGIDRLNLRLWLSNDKQRLPLRFTIGNYQADLVSSTIVTPK